MNTIAISGQRGDDLRMGSMGTAAEAGCDLEANVSLSAG